MLQQDLPQRHDEPEKYSGAELAEALAADLADEAAPDVAAEAAPVAPIELKLKDKNLEQLHDLLFEFGKEWTEEERAGVEEAYQQAAEWHKADRHKDVAYTYHLVRTATRVVGYLEQTDPALVKAALLHDSVEDHAMEILGRGDGENPIAPKEAHVRAFGVLSDRFGQRAANAVQAVTNPPGLGAGLSEMGKIEAYANKVEQAAITVDGWIIKFADWVDNGLSLSCAELAIPNETITKWEVKYGAALMRLEGRFRQDDIQAALSPAAKAYVEHQFALGRERLITEAPRA